MNPVIVLVGTQMAVNIGMCARAMLNCGLTELRLVTPRDGWPNEAAFPSAAGATSLLKNAHSFDSIDAALADCTRVMATSARPRGLRTPVLDLPAAVADLHSHQQDHPGEKMAILFGPEASGLDNEVLSRADTLVNYSLNPDYSSLNLAQAVLLFSWEWRQTSQLKKESVTNNSDDNSASQDQLTHFLARLEDQLDKGGYFPNPKKRPSTVRQLRSIFTRSNLSESELRGLEGVITSLVRSGRLES